MRLVQTGTTLFIVLNALALRLMWRAGQHRAAGSRRTALGLIARGSLAKRAEFSPLGWRYRQQAILLHVVAFVVFAVCLFTS